MNLTLNHNVPNLPFPPLAWAEERTCFEQEVGKREFIVQTGGNQQTRRNDEPGDIVPVGTRHRFAPDELERMASGECGLDELWGDESRRQSATKGGPADARTGESVEW